VCTGAAPVSVSAGGAIEVPAALPPPSHAPGGGGGGRGREDDSSSDDEREVIPRDTLEKETRCVYVYIQREKKSVAYVCVG
jgi:hypothetical protein